MRPGFRGLAAFAVPFLLILYLGLDSGGYEVATRSQAGIVAWWAVLVGVAAGLLPATRVRGRGWAVAGLLLALALWTGLAALTWTESAERSALELGRVLSLLGVFGLLLLVQGREGVRAAVGAVAAAGALLALVAFLSRCFPDLFEVPDLPANYPRGRLSFPLDYWNGLAALVAVAAAPLLQVAAAARLPWVRAAAAAALPLLGAVAYLTASRGGAVELAVAVTVLLALHPRRLALLPGLVLFAAGSGILMTQIDARPELRDAGTADLASAQGGELFVIALAVCLVCGLLQLGLALLEARGVLEVPRVPRRATRTVGLSVAGLALAAVLALLATGWAGDRWEEFKRPAEREATVGRLSSLASGERYAVWDGAVESASAHPLLGTGPGTYEYWWSREGSGEEFVRDAHSLYLEALAELGPLGLLLVAGLVGAPLALGAASSLGEGRSERRGPISAATAGIAAFAVSAAIDWTWELTVLPVAALALAAGLLGPSAESRRDRRESRFARRRPGPGSRVALSLGSLLAIAAIAFPWAGVGLVESSQREVREGDLEGALAKAEDAAALAPWAATPELQIALVELESGRSAEAVRHARAATRAEPTNWRTWFVLSQALAAEGRAGEAARALGEARRLGYGEG